MLFKARAILILPTLCYIALLAVCASANALPEPFPQGGALQTTTATKTIVSTKPAVTKTRTITTCTSRPSTATVTITSTTTRSVVTTTTTRTVRGPPVTITKPAGTVTRPASTITKPASTVTRSASTITKPATTVTITKSAITTITKPVSTVTKTANTITKTVTVTPTPSASKPPAYLEVITHSDSYCGTKPVDSQFQNPKDDQITVPVASGGSVCRSFKSGVASFSFLRLNADSYAAGCRIYYYSEQGCQNPINDGTSLSNENKCVNIGKEKMFSFQVLCGV